MGTYSKAVQALYVAYFNRPADVGGLAYWEADVAAQNGATGAVSAEMARSPEYRSLYEGLNATARIEAIYHNLFGREPDKEGLAFWSGALARNELTIDTVVAHIADGAVGRDRVALDAKVDIAQLFTETLVKNGKEEQYLSPQAMAQAKAMLAKVLDAASAAQAAESLAGTVSPAPAGTDLDDTFHVGKVERTDLDGGQGYDTVHIPYNPEDLVISWNQADTYTMRFSFPNAERAAWGTNPDYYRDQINLTNVEKVVFANGSSISKADYDQILAHLRPMQLATLAEGMYQAGMAPAAIDRGLVVTGTKDADTLVAKVPGLYFGGDGADTFLAGTGSHSFYGGRGRLPYDIESGMANQNTVDYSDSSAPINYTAPHCGDYSNAFGATVEHGGASDKLYGIGHVVGGAGNDTFRIGIDTLDIVYIDGDAGMDTVLLREKASDVNSLYLTYEGFLAYGGIEMRNIEKLVCADGVTVAVNDLVRVAKYLDHGYQTLEELRQDLTQVTLVGVTTE